MDDCEKCPPIAAFCELSPCLYAPDLDNLSAKLRIVSSPNLKYSRFLETRAGDWARSALGGVGRSLPLIRAFHHDSSTTNALTGATDRARKAIARIRELNPGWCISEIKKQEHRLTRLRSEHLARVIEGLSKGWATGVIQAEAPPSLGSSSTSKLGQ